MHIKNWRDEGSLINCTGGKEVKNRHMQWASAMNNILSVKCTQTKHCFSVLNVKKKKKKPKKTTSTEKQPNQTNKKTQQNQNNLLIYSLEGKSQKKNQLVSFFNCLFKQVMAIWTTV